MELSKIIARSNEPFMVPDADYGRYSLFGNVVFTCGALCKGNEIWIRYGVSDEVVRRARV